VSQTPRRNESESGSGRRGETRTSRCAAEAVEESVMLDHAKFA